METESILDPTDYSHLTGRRRGVSERERGKRGEREKVPFFVLSANNLFSFRLSPKTIRLKEEADRNIGRRGGFWVGFAALNCTMGRGG